MHTEQSTQCSVHTFSRKERMSPFSYSMVFAKKKKEKKSNSVQYCNKIIINAETLNIQH